MYIDTYYTSLPTVSAQQKKSTFLFEKKKMCESVFIPYILRSKNSNIYLYCKNLETKIHYC